MFGPLDKLGHGVFMVLNNGLVYNNGDVKYNSVCVKENLEKREGFKYRLTFDPCRGEIIFYLIIVLAGIFTTI